MTPASSVHCPAHPGESRDPSRDPSRDQTPTKTLGPPLPRGTRFALIGPGQGRPEATQFVRRPFVAPGLPELARRIHRQRGDAALELAPERVRWMGQTLDVVRVVAHDQTGDRRRLIGHAFIGGQDWRTLQAALHTQVPAFEVGA